MNEELCSRTAAIYKPGVPMAGVHHSYYWTGRMPCTGCLICYLCGKEKGESK